MIKAVIFDMDGVLRNTPEFDIKVVENAFKDLGHEINDKVRKLAVGRNPRDYIPMLLNEYGFNFDPVEFKKLTHKHFTHFLDKEMKLMPFVRETFEMLKKNNLKIAIATSASPRGAYQFFIDKFNFPNTFDVITTFDDCKERKPNPEVYLTSLRKLNLKAEECIVIEDTQIGLEAAKAAGIKCVVVPNEFTKDLDFTKADVIINSLKELNLDLIKRLEQ